MFASLPQVAVGERYTREDRRRDFMAVFAGDSTAEQGARVLAQICAICEGTPIGPRDVDNHALLAFRAAMRWVVAEIGNCMVERHETVKDAGAADPR